MSTPGQISLNNFYRSVMFTHPTVATLMSEDVIQVALYGMSSDKSGGKKAAERLRETALRHNLPEIQRRVLDTALTELGY